MLAVQDICIGYTDHQNILNDLDFSLQSGEMLAILGPNGAGKTTLLRCINGMIKPWSGCVEVDQADVFRMKATEIARTLGYVAQRNEAGRMTVFDAVLLGRKPHIQWKISEDDLSKTSGALQQLRLDHLALRHIDELSGGELQKVCIARALVQEPKVLLLDEPTSSLDLRNQLDILQTISRVVREHQIGAVMTMHDLNLAFRFADRFLFLKDGKIFANGQKNQIDSDTVAEVYGVQVEIVRHNGHTVIIPKL
ncbi:MAG: ABC transporter ATP-binding protein [Desulfopila sp.]|jgi:iron complex transport system ATP-binding protein|nr:ABC transporter ATP-binding protein [Desulfopila sp.]